MRIMTPMIQRKELLPFPATPFTLFKADLIFTTISDNIFRSAD